MIERKADRDEFERLFREIPKFNYVLNEKVNAIFGTDLEVATKSEKSEEKTEEFSDFLYSRNENGNTNLYEIKKALKEKEIFGESYLFFDKTSVYSLTKAQVSVYQYNDKDPIIDKAEYYTVGNVTIPPELVFNADGFIKQNEGYIISPANMIKFKSDSYALNSDLRQLQILVEINRKIYQSTTKRDYGDIFLFTNAQQKNIVSAVAKRIRDTTNEAIERMREHVANLIKKNKVEDSNVVILDESYKEVQQIAPITKITDYQFIWEQQDDIVTSVFNFPMLLAGLGDEAGNVSKEELLKEARANTLTPLKSDTANALSPIAKKLFGDEYYLRFQDYSEVSASFKEDATEEESNEAADAA
nr:MAG TPA: HK97 Family Phage Portal Protein [Caudoviricetes sp.]